MLSLCIAEADCPSSYGLAYKISGILWLTLSSETIPIWLENNRNVSWECGWPIVRFTV